METSLRYGGDSKSLRIHAKEKIPIFSNIVVQIQGELDTRVGTPTYLNSRLRFFYPDAATNFSLGVQRDKHRKLHYEFCGKTVFPVTSDNLLNLTVKAHCSRPEFGELNYNGKVEFVWNIFNIKKDQDLRIKAGYDVLDQIPYFQIRENNWAFYADGNRRWNVRYDL